MTLEEDRDPRGGRIVMTNQPKPPKRRCGGGSVLRVYASHGLAASPFPARRSLGRVRSLIRRRLMAGQRILDPLIGVRIPAPEPVSAANGPADAGLDPVESALAVAVLEATKAARWDVVGQLAKELEARRLARLSNVIPLGRKRGTP